MIPRLALVLAALVALGVAAVLLATGRDSGPPPLRADARPAEAFVDSIGVNVHFSYLDTSYAQQATVLARLRELGVRHIRDGMPFPIPAMTAGLRAASRQGIKGTLIGDTKRDPAPLIEESMEVMEGKVAAFEGPNELDAGAELDWPAQLRSYMPTLDAAVRRHAPGVSVIGPSFIDVDSRTQVPADLPGLLNGHPYPAGGPPEPAVADTLRALGQGAVERGVVFTETGYHNALAATSGQPPVSDEAAATYLPRALMTAFGAGVRRTFVYELLDEKPDPGLLDPEQHFGLLRNDLSPKPAFMAIQTLIRAVRDSPGDGVELAGSWSVRGERAGEVERLELVREDGSRVVALWRPVSVWDTDARSAVEPEPLPVELRFGRSRRDLTVWRPSLSPEPVLRRDRARRLPLELGGDLVLVSFR